MQTREKVGLHKLNIKTNAIIWIIACIAILLAILNLFRIPYTVDQHDVLYGAPGYEKTVHGDHLDYIREIADNNRLPETNDLQFYHPPLHHFICAMFLKVVEIFTSDVEVQNTVLQCVPLVEYILTMVVICKLLKTIHITGKYKVLIFVLLILHPSHYMLSRNLNNDMLVTLLTYTTIWRAFKWYQKPTIRNIILIGLFAGLAVMTKVSGGLVAIPILYLLIKRLVRDYKRSENKKSVIKKYFGQTVLLGVVALPIGLWYPIRNYIKFNQSLFYVLNPTDIFTMRYVGDKSVWQRFGLDFSQNAIYFRGRTSYNLPLGVIQTSIMGELGGIYYPEMVTTVLFMNMIAIVFSIYCFIKHMLAKALSKKHRTVKMALASFLIMNLISFVMVNIKLPYPCTMHFRYLLPSVLIAAIFIKYHLDSIRKKNEIVEKLLFGIILFFALLMYMMAILAQ